MYATVRSQAHEVHVLAVVASIREGRDNLFVLQDRVVGTSLVNLYQVLVNDAAGTDIEVTYLRVTHLTVGQTHIFATGLQLRVRIGFQQIVPIRSGGIVDYICV